MKRKQLNKMSLKSPQLMLNVGFDSNSSLLTSSIDCKFLMTNLMKSFSIDMVCILCHNLMECLWCDVIE